MPSPAGPNAPGTGATSSAGTLWSNPGNITADDSSYATANMVLGTTTRRLEATNFGFAIPTGATIDGIVVTWKRKTSSTSFSPRDSQIRIIKGGAWGATDRASGTTWPTTEGTATYGSSSDLWGETWTAADINSSTFGAGLVAQTNAGKGQPTLSVNYCTITVYYTEGGGGGGGQPYIARVSGVPGARLGGASFGRGW